MTQRSALLASLSTLKTVLKENSPGVESIIQQARASNPWFIPEFTRLALDAIADEFLDETKVAAWMAAYPSNAQSKRVAIIMAGNLPLVGFHDLLCVLAAGHQAIIKCSDKDAVLLPWLTSEWIRIAPELSASIQYTERLEGFDAVIATGSNNSSRYFEYYFKSYPHLLRKNRNGVAVLTGSETLEDLKLMSKDIFEYFGLGCRNVSKLYVPEGYDFSMWKDAVASWDFLADHHKYKHNLDYNFAIYIINSIPHIQLDHLILLENDQIASRIGSLHYSFYTDTDALGKLLKEKQEEIQCVVSASPLPGWDHVGFGESQQPRLDQYADGVDTMQFLSSL